jgi:septum formation protein
MNPLLDKSSQRNLVLASRSPRRFDLLESMGFEFDVVPASEEAERGVNHSDPYVLPVLAARRKCDEVAANRPDAIVVAADTVVIVDGEILNKPANDDEAKRFLARLSGRTHTVVTAVVIQRREDGVDLSASESTDVSFRELTEEEIAAYVATGEGRDKAGSYAAQGLGSSLIRSIDGCFYNVVGLPVALLCDLLRKIR